ncbi:MAG TPA: NADH-quinone oxidoreductase subunit C [Deltaproteobacteria bacterium]|nr:NADH-quinone oxidoreductase subunit C [Deltaproteobacteria bacterium]
MDLKKRVEQYLGPEGLVVAMTECQGDLSAEVPKRNILDVMHLLRDTPDLGFNFLSDVFGVDNLDLNKPKKKPKKKTEEGEGAEAEEEPKEKGPSPPRYEVVYLLLCFERNERLQVKVRVAEDDMEVDSLYPIWKASDWPEREIFDMFGIRFKGHPNLKRLLMWDDFPAHPLRKDYPLEGQGEERHLVYDD